MRSGETFDARDIKGHRIGYTVPPPHTLTFTGGSTNVGWEILDEDADADVSQLWLGQHHCHQFDTEAPDRREGARRR
jgi:hypothetical protein